MWKQVFASVIFACAQLLALAEPLPAEVQATLEKLTTDKDVCVVAIATVKSKVLAGSGMAKGCALVQSTSVDTAVHTTVDTTVFQAASLSKPVFAYAVLKLVEQGKLDLDVPVLNYLPQQDPRGYVHVQNPFSAGPVITDLVTTTELQTVTARMLLMHSSGLPNWANQALNFSFKPGTRWQYSGEGYVLLQRAVEAIASAPLNEVMERVVFNPIGMTNSSYVWSDRFKDSLVVGHARTGLAMRPTRFQAPVAAATLYTTAHDYAKFMAALMNDAKLLNIVLDSTIAVDKGLGLNWSLGWGTATSQSEAAEPNDRFIWQWGNNPGYRAFAVASVTSGDAVVILTNSDNGMAVIEPLVTTLMPQARDVFKFHMLR
jgi:CubicO group peptidase (beta-lactamase class C family)